MKLRFLLLAVTVIFIQAGHALADAPGILPTLVQCDKLLGKSPRAVLAVLRPPDSTSAAVLDMSRTNNVMVWAYRQAGVPIECDLLFFNKILVVVNERPLTADPNATPSSTTLDGILSKTMKACSPLSLKMLYIEQDAIQATNDNPEASSRHMGLMFIGKTPLGNVLSADGDSTIQGRPMIHKRSLNMDTGRYDDQYLPTQDFIVERVYPGGITLSKGQDGYKTLQLAIGVRTHNVTKLVSGSLVLIVKGTSLGVTQKNSPWFFSPQSAVSGP